MNTFVSFPQRQKPQAFFLPTIFADFGGQWPLFSNLTSLKCQDLLLSDNYSASYSQNFLSSFDSNFQDLPSQIPSPIGEIQDIDLKELSESFCETLLNGQDSQPPTIKKKVFNIIRNSPTVSGSSQSLSPKKYQIITKDEKSTILKHLKNHGLETTWEVFGSTNSKITKRKLKMWEKSMKNVNKRKGKQTNDPERDNILFMWYEGFKREYGRAPNRREVKKKALEVSEDPNFQASKGWLDKFRKKFKADLTPIKIFSQNKKFEQTKPEKNEINFLLKQESPGSRSTASTQNSTSSQIEYYNRDDNQLIGMGDDEFSLINLYFNFHNEQVPDFPFEKLDEINL